MPFQMDYREIVGGLAVIVIVYIIFCLAAIMQG